MRLGTGSSEQQSGIGSNGGSRPYPNVISPSNLHHHHTNLQTGENQLHSGGRTLQDNINHHNSNSPHHRRSIHHSSSTTGSAPSYEDREERDDNEKASKKLKKRSFFYQWLSFWSNSSYRNLSTKRIVVGTFVLVFAIYALVLGIKKVMRFFQGEKLPPESTLDFLIAGFPKTGTTSLLFALRQHEQVIMDTGENCQIARPIQQDDINLKRLNRYLDALKKSVLKEKEQAKALREQALQGSWFSPLRSSPQTYFAKDRSELQFTNDMRLGMKCPDAIKNFKAIHRLTKHSPNCKFVIGVRHPILFMQSFYNYRVLEAYKKNKVDEGIPTLYDIWDEGKFWWDISKDSPRYELFLSQFGKTSLSIEQLDEYFADRQMLAVKPNRFRIFLYTMEQLQDEAQSLELRRDLQHFLGLSTEISSFGHQNSIQGNKDYKHRETIDICEPEFYRIRVGILNYAEATIKWMHEFLNSPDVVVSNRPYLLKSIEAWKNDPCASIDHMKLTS